MTKSYVFLLFLLFLIAIDVSGRMLSDRHIGAAATQNYEVVKLSLPQSRMLPSVQTLIDSLRPDSRTEVADVVPDFKIPEHQEGKLKQLFSGDWRYQLQAIVIPSRMQDTQQLEPFALLLGTHIKSKEQKLIQLVNQGKLDNFDIRIQDTDKVQLYSGETKIELIMYQQTPSEKQKG
ncbi:hypothetical protein [Pseudoalteromonas xiamenensis]